MKKLITIIDGEEEEVIFENGRFLINDSIMTIVNENPLLTTIEINGETLQVDEIIYLPEEGIYRVEIRGYTIDVNVVDPISEALKSSNVSGDVKSPMAGTISTINVTEGMKVKKGQVLVIISAMKMENQITSPIDGKVETINIKNNQQVPAGKLIVVISQVE